MVSSNRHGTHRTIAGDTPGVKTAKTSKNFTAYQRDYKYDSHSNASTG